MRMVVPILAVGFVAVAASLAFAASPLDNAKLPGRNRYERCLSLAQAKPKEAFSAALAWRDNGGGAPARHCIVVALVGLKQYGEAAYRLDQLAHDPSAGGADNRADILDQSGNAWMLADQPQNAVASFSAALKLTPDNADILADRARARAMRKNWSGAVADLGAALMIAPDHPEWLVLRASARRALGDNKAARADLDKALRLKPDYDEALVERGAMEFDAGNRKAARADWRKVIMEAPKSAAADAARTHIEQLELNAPVGKD